MSAGYLIHHKSAEALKSELDLFTVPYTQTSIISNTVTEYRPINSIEDQKTIEFHIIGNGEEYIDLSDIYLNIKARIIKSDNTLMDEKSKVSPVNGLLHSLFSEVTVKLGNKIISASDQDYPYKAYFGTLLSNENISESRYLPLEMFYKDIRATAIDGTTAGKYEGIYKRHTRCKSSKTMDMIGRLNSEMFHQKELLPPTLSLMVYLVRKNDKFCLLQPDDDKTEYKIDLLSASLYVRKVRVNPSISTAHMKNWMNTSIKYPLRRIECRSFSIARDSRDVYLNNVHDGQLPSFVLIALVDSDARAGNVNKNPFNFLHKGLTFLDLQIDSTSIPGVPFQPNFAKSEYSRLHQQLFLATSKYYGSSGIDITFDEYGEGQSLFAYDLTSDQSGLTDGHFNLGRNGTMRITMKFQSALDQTINVIVYSILQNIIEIDHQGNVICDF